MKKADLHTDGGARGNPGPAGTGYVLELEDGKKIREGHYIGENTNNQAEYDALRRGMERAVLEGVTHLNCFLDSELIVKQMTGVYRVKNGDLRLVYAKICDLAEKFETVTFKHVRREKNQQADKLVNMAIDKKGAVVL